MIKRIVVQTSEGTRVLTCLDLTGSKTYIRENIFKELLKVGIKYDAQSGKFIQPEVQALRRTLGKSLVEVREILKQP